MRKRLSDEELVLQSYAIRGYKTLLMKIVVMLN